MKYHQLFVKKTLSTSEYSTVRNSLGESRAITESEYITGIEPGWRVFKSTDLNSRSGSSSTSIPYLFNGKEYRPRDGAGWRTNLSGLKNLEKAGRLMATKNTLRYVQYLDDFPYSIISNVWDDVMGANDRIYVVQTNEKIVSRCILISTDPGDLVLDIICGSGTNTSVGPLSPAIQNLRRLLSSIWTNRPSSPSTISDATPYTVDMVFCVIASSGGPAAIVFPSFSMTT